MSLSRRGLLRLGAAAAASWFSAGTILRNDARLKARPGKAGQPWPAGERPLGLATGRDGFVYVPAGVDPARPAPLIVMLHGAGGRALNFRRLIPRADEQNVILLATDSREMTWDAIRGSFDADVAFLDRALQHTFEHCTIDNKRIALGGFSDGASYALSVGLNNGDLFTHLIAFSPGFMIPPGRVGKPRIFVSHGTKDSILPVSSSNRRIVPSLKNDRYEVRYEEFDGPHTVPEDIARAAFAWLTA